MAAESSSPLEDSKSSSDETDKSEKNYEYSRTGRSYECVFCKRGFTTAQALGGHMNIHRKHRAPKIMITNPSNNNFSADHHHQDPSVSSNLTAGDHHHHDEGYANFGSLFAIQSYQPVHFIGHHDDHQVHVNYQTNYNNNFSTTNWGASNNNCCTRPTYSVRDFNYSRYDHHIIPNDLLRENCWSSTALSLGLNNYGAPRNEEDDDEDEDHDDHEHNCQKISGDFGQDRVEIDLELRLGYDP